MSRNTNDEKISAGLSGNTLSVYLYLLRKGANSCGVREVQRSMNFSSPSTANYHLEKLEELGLVSKDGFGNYKIRRIVKTGIMSAYVFFGRFAVPKHLFYAAATTLMIIAFTILFFNSLSTTVAIAMSPGMLAAAIFWYETVRIWMKWRSLE